MTDFLFLKALFIQQAIKRVAVKLFRLRTKEMATYDTLDEAVSRGFQLKKLTSTTFILCDKEETNRFVLRKGGSDLLVFNQVVLQQEYRSFAELIVKHVDPTKIRWAIDAGANIGFTSLYFSKQFQHAGIIAIEPSSENFQILLQNIASHKNIKPLQKALWYENINVKISRDFRDGQDWSLSVQPDPSGQGSIEAITLHDIMAKENIEAIDVLKIDIEGAEKELLADESFLKLLTSVKFIALELHEEVIDKIQVINQLQKIGFELTYKGETLFGVNKNLV